MLKAEVMVLKLYLSIEHKVKTKHTIHLVLTSIIESK